MSTHASLVQYTNKDMSCPAGTVDGRDKEAALGLATDGRNRAALVPHALQGRTGVDAEGHQL